MTLDRSKLYYISLTLFFVLGAFVTAYVQGENTETRPDMSRNTPEFFVGYFNNYLHEKVTPSTMADVLITEYITHPMEATGVVPLHPAQSVSQENYLVNCSVSEFDTYISTGEDTFGTIIGVGVYRKSEWDRQIILICVSSNFSLPSSWIFVTRSLGSLSNRMLISLSFK